MSHSFSYLSSLPLVTDPVAVALNDCAIDRLHKDRCAQAFGRNTLSKPHSGWHTKGQWWHSLTLLGDHPTVLVLFPTHFISADLCWGLHHT